MHADQLKGAKSQRVLLVLTETAFLLTQLQAFYPPE